MSLPRKGAVGALSRTIRCAAVCGLIGASAVSLSGCGFQPLYGPTASGAQLSDVMKTVDITTVPGRVGQRIRNELIFRTTGGGYAEAPKYRLDIALRESLQKTLVNQQGDAQGEIYQLYTEYKLVRVADRKVVLEGHSNARAAFDKPESVFASIRAQRDAEDRAARTISEAIRTRVAAFLSTNA
jgi:LPS-assembly lipoprotein